MIDIPDNLKKKVTQIDYSTYKQLKEFIGTISSVSEKHQMVTRVVTPDGEFLEKKRAKGNSLYYVTENLLSTYKEISTPSTRNMEMNFC